MTINQWIRKHFKKSKKSKYWLAKQLGCSWTHIDNLLAKQQPSQLLFRRMVSAFATAQGVTEKSILRDWYDNVPLVKPEKEK